MKHVKTIIAMLLLAAMLLSLCACGEDAKEKPTEMTTEPTTETTTEPTTEPTTTEPTTETPTELVVDHDIVGSWNFPLPCAEQMELALLGGGFECDVDDDMALILTLTYNEDGTYSVQADADSANAMVDEMLRAMSTVMPELLYAEFAKQGWDKETTDAQLAAQGLTMDALVAQSMAQVDTSGLDFSSAFEAESYYIVEDNVFYTASSMEDLLAGEYIDATEFAIEGDQMQFLSCEVYNEDATSLEQLVSFPLTLNRK